MAATQGFGTTSDRNSRYQALLDKSKPTAVKHNLLVRMIILALVISGAFILAYMASSVSFGHSNDGQPSNDSLFNDNSAGSGSSESSGSSSPENDKGSGSSSSQSSQTSVTVNGQTIKVPQNGTYQETVNTSNGSTTVSGENHESSNVSGNNSSNSSSSSVNIQSQSP